MVVHHDAVAVVPGLARASEAGPQRIHRRGPVEQGRRRGVGALAVDGKRNVHRLDVVVRTDVGVGVRRQDAIHVAEALETHARRRDQRGARVVLNDRVRSRPQLADVPLEPFFALARLVMGARLDRHDVAQRARDVLTVGGDARRLHGLFRALAPCGCSGAAIPTRAITPVAASRLLITEPRGKLLFRGWAGGAA